MRDLLFRPVSELAALVRAGEVTARELVAASLERIEALDGAVNAFVHVDADGALATAATIGPDDGRPFAGVPVAIKDNRAVAGMPMGLGSRLLQGYVPRFDAALVRRLRDAGFVIVGTTAMPEFGIMPTTEPVVHGPTRNPWDLTRTPGGSSGGAAAAVAAGMVPIAHGNDGGGSIRIPAACCGLVGLKPARGRISVAPTQGESFLVVDGMLTRTVAETAALLDVLAGPEPGDASWAPPPAEPFARAAARMPDRLRIGVTLRPSFADATVDPAAADATWDAAALLEELGHAVEEIAPPWDGDGLAELFAAAFGPAVASAIAGASGGREPTPDAMEPLSWLVWERARALPAPRYLAAVARIQSLAREAIVASAAYDAILTPALAQRPVPVGTLHGATDDPADAFRRGGLFTGFTQVANMTGQPAIALPLAHGDDGLPLAVQLIGRPAQEGTLLALAAQLEAARPWADRRPPLPAGSPPPVG